jgi:two-component system chemotaxis response regulator CheY
MEPKLLPCSRTMSSILFLCDINMPVMDGLESVQRLSSVAHAKNVPVIMITSGGSESDVLPAIASGAKGYLRKPFAADQVRAQIRSVPGAKG